MSASATTMAKGETRTITFDFTSDPTLGTDTLTGTPTVTLPSTLVTDPQGATIYTYAAGLTASGSASIHTKQVWQNIVIAAAAVVGVTYTATCTVTTSSSQILVHSVKITIVAAANA